MTIEASSETKEKEKPSLLDIYSEGFEPSKIPPTHLIFIIHGIGYKMFDKSKFNENINTLSETAKTVLEQKYTDKEMKLFYAPIEWAEEFHALTTVDGRMNKITLPTVPAMRVITNDCLSDVLYYFTDYHRQHLLDIICMKMNRIFKEFKEVYPDFCGPVGIISHSLGGVISYDLLSIKNQEVGSNDQIYSVAFPRTNYPKLDFEPKFLFTLGSPIGAVMVLRGLKYEDFRLSEDIEFMNIYNPYDPLAYRLEPLISQDYEGLEAKSIDTYETNEQSYYFPRISALLPEAPSFIKSAKNLLPNFNRQLEDEDDEDSLGGYESSDEGSVDSLELSNESITVLKSEDDISTRSLSGFSVSAVGISGYKRGSVIERLHEIKYNRSSPLPSESNSAVNSRPSSFYQGAIDSLFSYPKFNSLPKPSPKPKTPPRRPKIGKYYSRHSIAHKQISPKPFNRNVNSKDIVFRDNNSESSSHLLSLKYPFSVDIKESEISSSYEDVGTSKYLETHQHSNSIKAENDRHIQLSRSKTWNHLDRLKDGCNEEEIMWLWGSMAFNIQQNKLNEKAQTSAIDLNSFKAKNEEEENDNKGNNLESLSNTKKPKKKVTMDDSCGDAKKDLSQPRLIRNLTPRWNRSVKSETSINSYFDDVNNLSQENNDLISNTKINLPDENCHSTTVDLERHPGNTEARDVLIQEKKALDRINSDAQFPPVCCNGVDKVENLKRYDYCIQTKAISNLSMEYFVGLGAHFSYWDNKDLAQQMIKTMLHLKDKKREGGEPAED